jgi:hypothetical protein
MFHTGSFRHGILNSHTSLCTFHEAEILVATLTLAFSFMRIIVIMIIRLNMLNRFLRFPSFLLVTILTTFL